MVADLKAKISVPGKKSTKKRISRKEQKETLVQMEKDTVIDIDRSEALIKELSDDSITNQLYDESGQLIKLTAGQKSGNPTLMAIEASLASSSQG